MKAPALLEADFMDQVTQYAELKGWLWLHVRAGRTDHSWRVPMSGPLGKGWPDLFMIRHRDERVMGIELKREGAKQTPAQEEVEIQFLSIPGLEFYVWHPSDWPEIEKVLA